MRHDGKPELAFAAFGKALSESKQTRITAKVKTATLQPSDSTTTTTITL